MARRKNRIKRGARHINIDKGNMLYSLLVIIIFIGGFLLISRQVAEAQKAKAVYDEQQRSIEESIAKEKELLNDKKNLDNPDLFEEIARKNGYRKDNETAVDVTRPITEDDKWK